MVSQSSCMGNKWLEIIYYKSFEYVCTSYRINEYKISFKIVSECGMTKLMIIDFEGVSL